jgi:hypothetical protein
MSEKIDLKKNWPLLYKPSSKNPAIVEVPPANYLMIDGTGSPNSAPRFKAAIESLYPLAYNLKFTVRKHLGIDYGVMPLEGLYWGTPKGQTQFTEADKEKWSWTLMILQPEWVTSALFESQRLEVAEKKNPPLIQEIRFEILNEGTVTQILHIGSFDTEAPNAERMHALAFQQGYQLCGKHHEIYLNDFNRTTPERLKTVLRHPICK